MSRGRGSGSASARDDHQLVGVGDDDALDRVGVVGGAAQHRACAGSTRTMRARRVRLAGHVTDERDPVADDDAVAAELAGLHRRDHALVRGRRPGVAGRGRPRPRTLDGVLVARAVLGRGRVPCGPGGPGRRPRRGACRSVAPAMAQRPPSIPVHSARGTPGASWRSSPTSSTRTPGDRQADHRAGRRQPVVVVGWKTPPCSGRGPDAQPSAVSVTSPPSSLISLGERRQPVGLVAADVRDAAQRATGSRRARPARRDRGQLADLAQVDVDARGSGRCRRRSDPPRSAARRPPISVKVRAARRRAGCVCVRPARHGHPAAGHQRRRQERRGVGQVRLDVPSRPRRAARARPARRPARRRPRAPGARSMSTVIADVRRARAPAARVAYLTPRSKRAAASSSPDTNWEDAEASIVDRRRRSPAGAVHGERQPPGRRRRSGAEGAQRVDQRCIGACRAAGRRRSGPRRRRGPRPAAGSASRCRRGRRRSRAGPRSRRGDDSQVGAEAPAPRHVLDATPSAPERRHQQGVAGAQRPRAAGGLRAASAASTSARLVSDFEPGTVTVASTGLRAMHAPLRRRHLG